MAVPRTGGHHSCVRYGRWVVSSFRVCRTHGRRPSRIPWEQVPVGFWHTTPPERTLCLLTPTRLLRQGQTSNGRREKLFELGYPRNAVTFLLGSPAPNAFSHRYQGWPTLAPAIVWICLCYLDPPTTPSERVAHRRGGPIQCAGAGRADANNAGRVSGWLSRC